MIARTGTSPERFGRVAVFGGVYSNHHALAACIADARTRGAEALFCLGDLGAFGPHPARVFPLLETNRVRVVQGNYDHSIGNDLEDCGCGYTDPRDNHFARLSYGYTLRNTPSEWKPWLRALPSRISIMMGAQRVLFFHGSPRRTNEFVWQSTASTAFLDRLAREADADVLVGSHTGLHWQRRLSENADAQERRWVNAGAIGRPANDGSTQVWYCFLEATSSGEVDVEFVRVGYDHDALALEMRAEGLPAEFVETILTGWWTTCLEVLPQKERRRARY
jgi:diadenosine tetraphosphatase ApaH/serine/threonine PP2A family protein phosphatase